MIRCNVRDTARSLCLVGLLAIFTTLGGCGYKDRPVPPQQVVPKAVTDLRYQLSEKGVSLYWSYPIETMTGNDLTDIASFQMYRAVVPVDSYCDSCPIPFGKSIPLGGGALPGEGRKTASYQATLLRPGNLYFFKVRSKTGWLAESEDSNVISFLWDTPPLAPTGLEVKAGDKKIELNWQPVTTHLDGTPITEEVLYQVLRSVGNGPMVQVGKPVSAITFTDTSVQNNRKYFYQVQAVSVYEQGTVGGGSTDSVAASPVDRTPPAVPAGIRGIKTGVGIKIYWTSVADKDVKGYRIYRRSANEGAPELVGEVELPYNMFIDRNPPKNISRLHYSVSSIDNRTPANESASSKEVQVRN